MNTKPITHAGIALILLGIVAFTYQGSDIPVHDPASYHWPAAALSVAISQIMVLPPLAAGMVLLSGILLVVVGIKKTS